MLCTAGLWITSCWHITARNITIGNAKKTYTQSDLTGAAQIWHTAYTHLTHRGQPWTGGGVWYLQLPCCCCCCCVTLDSYAESVEMLLASVCTARCRCWQILRIVLKSSSSRSSCYHQTKWKQQRRWKFVCDLLYPYHFLFSYWVSSWNWRILVPQCAVW